MKRVVVFAIVGMVWGCGAGESVMNPLPESNDAGAAARTAPSSSASEAPPAPIPCSAGNERIEVHAASGTMVLSEGCGDAGVASASMLPGGEDGPWPLELVACLGAASVDVRAEEMYPGGGTGSYSGVMMRFDDGANLLQTWGPVNVDTWTPVGDLVSGTFTSSPEPQAPHLSGAFCLRRLR